MTDTQQTPELGSLKLPDTEPYRVTGLGAVYTYPVESIGPDGAPRVVYAQTMAGRGEVVDLVAHEARRLQDLGAVRPADEPRGYDELGDDELAALVAERNIPVTSSSADPDRPRREDFLNALALIDRGGAVGAATTPGGVLALSDSGSSRVLVDGREPAVSTADGPPSDEDLARGTEGPVSPALQPDEGTKRSGAAARKAQQAKG